MAVIFTANQPNRLRCSAFRFERLSSINKSICDQQRPYGIADLSSLLAEKAEANMTVALMAVKIAKPI
jgi:hypothetical protein